MRYIRSYLLFCALLVGVVSHNSGVIAVDVENPEVENNKSELNALLDADVDTQMHENEASRKTRQFFPGFGFPFFGGGFGRPFYGGGFGRPFYGGGFGGFGRRRFIRRRRFGFFG